jgi:hypothetical protein
MAAPFDLQYDAEFYTVIDGGVLKIDASSGECGIRCRRIAGLHVKAHRRVACRHPASHRARHRHYGLAGVLMAVDEGFELNVLGLNIGIDAAAPALKLPAIGRLGLDR